MMFRRPKSAARYGLPLDVRGFIGEGDELSGDLRFRVGYRIDGTLRGTIDSPSTLVVGPTGSVDVEHLSARGLTVSGRVRGDLVVGERLQIHAGGEVAGNVTLRGPGLVMEPGARFDGSIRIVAPEVAPPEAQP